MWHGFIVLSVPSVRNDLLVLKRATNIKVGVPKRSQAYRALAKRKGAYAAMFAWVIAG